MATFPIANPIDRRSSIRVSQQRILPTAVKPAQLAQTTLVNTQGELLGPFSIANGSSLVLQSIITNTNDPNFRLGAVPYCIVYFQTTVATANIIGGAITGTGYSIKGPMAMPGFSPFATPGVLGGNDDNNLVFLTELVNSSGGGPQTIFAITNTRVYTPLGGEPG